MSPRAESEIGTPIRECGSGEQPPAGSSCCGPSPQTSGSCCGGTAKAEPAEQRSACCDASPRPERTPRQQSSCCGASPVAPADYPYGPAAFVTGAVETPAGPVPRVSRDLTRADRLGAWRMRRGFGREDYRVKPGLYGLGAPAATSPVLVTGNYKLTLDQLRSSLDEVDAWLLVVDTRGINVWCAAGKGTFCADEVVRMVAETRLAEVVEHRRLILPQLSAPGVAAHKVKEACGFRVTFGPVRAADLPAFLAGGMKADGEMRKVTFDLRERAVLAPAELTIAWDRRVLLACAGILVASSIGADGVSLSRALRRGAPIIGAGALALVAGGGVTPLALPWLPGRAFSLKGAVAGAVLATAATAMLGRRLSPAAKLALLAGVPAVSSYAAMNFTGSSPITSPSGVELEMRRSLPWQGAAAAVAVGAWLASRLGR
jgi:hypothetical protein